MAAIGGHRRDLRVPGVDRGRAGRQVEVVRPRELGLADGERVDRAAVREVAVADRFGAVEEP